MRLKNRMDNVEERIFVRSLTCPKCKKEFEHDKLHAERKETKALYPVFHKLIFKCVSCGNDITDYVIADFEKRRAEDARKARPQG